MSTKLHWSGDVISVQPRIRLLRSFDERTHSYLGYALRVAGTVDGEQREFTVGIGRGAQRKHGFRVGDRVSGLCEPVADARREPVEFYKASKLTLIDRSPGPAQEPPPWVTVPPDLDTYRERGHRRLSPRTYKSRCLSCIWGCRMPVEIIVDHWNPNQRKWRFETFCYGPKSCPVYKPGPTRKVPGRKGMSWEDEDWVDEQATVHRGRDE